MRPFSISCSLLFVAACASAPPPPSRPSALLSHSLPAFEGDTLTHNHFYTAQGTNHPMIVHFFSADCRDCPRTLSAAQSFYAGNSDLIVVGVSEDESPGHTQGLVDRLGLHFPVVLDRDGRIARQYEVTEMPALFVVSPYGKVSWLGGADTTEDSLRAAVSVAQR
jgi:peroxiredoxin